MRHVLWRIYKFFIVYFHNKNPILIFWSVIMNEIIAEYKYSLQLMHDQSKYAESKNASLIVFSSALIFGIISNIDNIRMLFFWNNLTFLPFFKDDVYIIGNNLLCWFFTFINNIIITFLYATNTTSFSGK
jgi:hypothetical protein